jgi:HEPN domain-containing protein
MRQDTDPWWRQADADLQVADLALTGGLYFAVSWFAHQAAEKAIKALYNEQNGRQANRVHDLHHLGRAVAATAEINRDLATLDPAFGQTRYPDAAGVAPVDLITAPRAARDMEAARRVLLWVQSQL